MTVLVTMRSISVSTTDSSPVSCAEQRLASDAPLVDCPDTHQSQEERVKAVDDGVDEVTSEDGGQVKTEAGGEDHKHEAGDESLGHQGEQGEGGHQGEQHGEGPGEHCGELSEPLHHHLRHNKVEVLMLGATVPAALASLSTESVLVLGSITLRRRSRVLERGRRRTRARRRSRGRRSGACSWLRLRSWRRS
jgi:hypothetical protein